jgi:hypothetical protein
MINQTLCTSFKRELFLGVHDFRVVGGDTFKLALYDATADLGADTVAYTTAGEVSGPGYTAGGIVLTRMGTEQSGTTAFTDFQTVAFTGATFTARGALVYNTTPSALGPSDGPLVNPAVCVLDFGSDKTVTSGTFAVQFPPRSATTSIIRIA